MQIDNLIFVSFNHYVVALDRNDGSIVWQNGDFARGHMNLLLDGDRLIVSSNGYMYCLDPTNGRQLWHNPLTGYGIGAPSMTSVRGQASASLQNAESVDQQNSG